MALGRRNPALHNENGVNDTTVLRSVVLARLWMEKLLPPLLTKRARFEGHLLLTPRKIIKIKHRTDITEAGAMLFIAENTQNVPVPKVYGAFVKSGKSYTVMQRMPGKTLVSAWKDLTLDQREYITQHMQRIMEEIRSLEPPHPGMVGSFSYGLLTDFRLPNAPCGPFDNVTDFQKNLNWDLVQANGNLEKEQLIAAMKTHPTCFSHCDLGDTNILVSGGLVSAILDWEMAGWFPIYWEYVRACQSSVYSFWEKETSKYLMEYPSELETESLRQKLFPSPF